MVRLMFVVDGLALVSESVVGASCDRASLASTLDRCRTAVVEHDAAAAPLTVGFRRTENALVRE